MFYIYTHTHTQNLNNKLTAEIHKKIIILFFNLKKKLKIKGKN